MSVVLRNAFLLSPWLTKAERLLPAKDVKLCIFYGVCPTSLLEAALHCHCPLCSTCVGHSVCNPIYMFITMQLVTVGVELPVVMNIISSLTWFFFFFSNSLQGLLGGPTPTTLPSDKLAWTSSPAGLAPCRWSTHRWDWTRSCLRTRSPSSARNTGTSRGSDRTGAPSGENPRRGRRERKTLEGRRSSGTTPGRTGSDKALSSTQHIANDHSAAAAATTWCGEGWIGN